MPLPGLILREAPPPRGGLTSRADVALFVGLVHRRGSDIPDGLRRWLSEAGWTGSAPLARSDEHVAALLDVPVPVESWDAFEMLFAWEARRVGGESDARVPCPLGAAVRSFFAEGGMRAYVVRCGDPLPLVSDGDAVETKRRLLAWANAAPPPEATKRVPLLPGFGGRGTPAHAARPSTWRGAAHVFGLEDVALMGLPDLPDLCAGLPGEAPVPPLPPIPPEQFKPCAPPAPGAAPDPRRARVHLAAPRLDNAGYALWGEALAHMLSLLATPSGASHRRDVMLVASLPLPTRSPGGAHENAESRPLAKLAELGLPRPGERLLEAQHIGSARLQLAYPWLETAASAAMPEGVEGGEGALMGAVARTALDRGAFNSLAGTPLRSVSRTLPALAAGDLARGLDDGRTDWLGDRICLAGGRLSGFEWLSDATMADDRAWRAGGVSRLVGILLRAARTLGQDLVFEPMGPPLWDGLRRELEAFLTVLWAAGALNGETAAEAFDVRCDRTTMTQADIDSGRTIARVAFTPAYPIERITVTLALGADALGPMREAA